MWVIFLNILCRFQTHFRRKKDFSVPFHKHKNDLNDAPDVFDFWKMCKQIMVDCLNQNSVCIY